jgi:fructose-1,6-bisphosphatase/inositol monophosphatase family enzyme
MTATHPLLKPLRDLHARLRNTIIEAYRHQTTEDLAAVADDGPGDTIFAIDKLGEQLLLQELSKIAASHGGIIVIAEGISEGRVTLPADTPASRCRYVVIVDPIDGTRGLMYQKRPAWILTGVAKNRGDATRLTDVELAVQTEIPLVKQHLCDELWAVRGLGAKAERINLTTGDRSALTLRPSRAPSIEQAFATVSRFFPGVRDELAAIDDELVHRILGAASAGKARCFEDQYLSTGGQLYELMAGHDRFIADLRPLLAPVWLARGMPLGLCCHPYDLCTALIAEELGVVVRNAAGGGLDFPLDIETNVHWVGYANTALAALIEPIMLDVLRRRGFLHA